MYPPVVLLGGLALLLGGLATMRLGLKKLFSPVFRRLLAKLTLSPWRGFLVGAVGAALAQSSTMIILMTIGLVNGEYLSFYQGLGIVLGANVGTCSTVGLLSLAPPLQCVLAILPVSVAIAALSVRLRPVALAIAGMFAMFSGVGFLAEGLAAVSQLEIIIRWLTSAGQNPLAGIGGGILLTFLFQSSSAATALLMVLASEGAIDLTAAAYGMYGNNIGSCLSSLLVGAGAALAARRVAVAHVVLNIAGVILFLPATGLLTTAATSIAADFGVQVAVMHTLFNLVSSLVALPLCRPLARLIVFFVPR